MTNVVTSSNMASTAVMKTSQSEPARRCTALTEGGQRFPYSRESGVSVFETENLDELKSSSLDI